MLLFESLNRYFTGFVLISPLLHFGLVLLVDVIYEVQRLFLNVELYGLGQVLEHELARFDYVLRLRVIVALLYTVNK